jgi:hypothetical protein
MIVVKIEVWPHGDRQQARLIGSCVIVNNETGSAEKGNYEVGLSHSGIYYGKRKGLWKKGTLTGHLRSLSPYHLVMRAIQSALGDKQ